MRQLLSLFGISVLLLCASGCKTTRAVVIDKDADWVILGPNVKCSAYLFLGGKWVLVKSVKLPEGWYAGPGPKEEN